MLPIAVLRKRNYSIGCEDKSDGSLQAVGAGVEPSKGLAEPKLLRAGVSHITGSGPISVGFGPGPKEGWTSGVVVDGFIDRRSRAKPPRWVSIRTGSESARRVRWQVPRSPNVA